MTGSTEAGHDILEVGVIGVHLHAILREIGYLSRDASVEDKAQRVDS